MIVKHGRGWSQETARGAWIGSLLVKEKIMTKTPSRRDFLKSGLAATTMLMVGTKAARASQGPQLFEKSSIGSLQLNNRFMKSSTWTGTGDKKGYITDRALTMHNELAKGGVGLILTGNQIVMTNGTAMPYSIGNYDDSQTEGLKSSRTAFTRRALKSWFSSLIASPGPTRNSFGQKAMKCGEYPRRLIHLILRFLKR